LSRLGVVTPCRSKASATPRTSTLRGVGASVMGGGSAGFIDPKGENLK
jgi:hypothetical protein